MQVPFDMTALQWNSLLVHWISIWTFITPFCIQLHCLLSYILSCNFFYVHINSFLPSTQKASGVLQSSASVGQSFLLSVHTFHQHNISSMHSWRKVICYLIMPLGVAKKPIEGEFPWPICVGEYGEKLRNLLEGKKLRNVLEGVNTLFHQCIGGE